MGSTTEYIGRRLLGLPTKAEIITLCQQNGPTFNGITYTWEGRPIAYIKYGSTVTMGEALTQLYAFEQTVNESGARVPEIYHAFKSDSKTYILMEYIDGETVRERVRKRPGDRSSIYEQVAGAVNQLLRLPPPENSGLGPIGGGHAHHCFFPDHLAPKQYTSFDDLQNHINRVLRITHYKGRVDFSSDKWIFYYADINSSNFIITEAGQLYVIDFEEAGFLPETFMSFVLHKPAKPLISSISAKIPLQKSKNLDAMSRASYILKIASSSMLGPQ